MTASVDKELHWQAARYLLGELPAAECSAFELQLADDLAACEAVAAASRLVQMTRAALASPAVTVEIRRSRCLPRPMRGGWLAVVATSAAVAMLCLAGLQTPVGPDRSALVHQNSAEAELVSLWRAGMNSRVDDSDEMEELSDPSGDVAVPGWMLAAVSLETRGPIDGTPEPVQEN